MIKSNILLFIASLAMSFVVVIGVAVISPLLDVVLYFIAGGLGLWIKLGITTLLLSAIVFWSLTDPFKNVMKETYNKQTIMFEVLIEQCEHFISRPLPKQREILEQSKTILKK